jgi:hypothetical protein
VLAGCAASSGGNSAPPLRVFLHIQRAPSGEGYAANLRDELVRGLRRDNAEVLVSERAVRDQDVDLAAEIRAYYPDIVMTLLQTGPPDGSIDMVGYWEFQLSVFRSLTSTLLWQSTLTPQAGGDTPEEAARITAEIIQELEQQGLLPGRADSSR